MPVTQTQKPPPGFVFIEDYEDGDGNVTPGVATRLGISVSTYRKWRLAKKGPQTFRHGKRVMARETVVDAWLAGLGEDDMEAAESAREVAAHDARPAEPRVGHQHQHGGTRAA